MALLEALVEALVEVVAAVALVEVALVEADGAEEAGRLLHDAYRDATGIDAAWFLTAAGAGPSVVVG